jgi:hypothetical protein
MKAKKFWREIQYAAMHSIFALAVGSGALRYDLEAIV